MHKTVYNYDIPPLWKVSSYTTTSSNILATSMESGIQHYYINGKWDTPHHNTATSVAHTSPQHCYISGTHLTTTLLYQWHTPHHNTVIHTSPQYCYICGKWNTPCHNTATSVESGTHLATTLLHLWKVGHTLPQHCYICGK